MCWGGVLLWLVAGQVGASLQLLLATFSGSRRQRMKLHDDAWAETPCRCTCSCCDGCNCIPASTVMSARFLVSVHYECCAVECRGHH